MPEFLLPATEFGVMSGTHAGHGERWLPLVFREPAPPHALTETNMGLKAKHDLRPKQ